MMPFGSSSDVRTGRGQSPSPGNFRSICRFARQGEPSLNTCGIFSPDDYTSEFHVEDPPRVLTGLECEDPKDTRLGDGLFILFSTLCKESLPSYAIARFALLSLLHTRATH